MNLVFIENNRPVTDSLTVAEVFGKSHDHVMRDIRQQLEKLCDAGMKEWGVSNFGETHYQHPQNKQWYPKFNMTEDAFAIVAMSYVTPEAMKMKVRFLEDFKAMREQLAKPQFALPQTYAEALRLAADLTEQNERIAAENKAKEQQLSLQAPKVALYDTAMNASNNKPVGSVAKMLGYGPNKLFAFLREQKILRHNNEPYQEYIDRGYFDIRLYSIPHTSGDIENKTQTLVTAKGIDFIYKLLVKHGKIREKGETA